MLVRASAPGLQCAVQRISFWELKILCNGMIYRARGLLNHLQLQGNLGKCLLYVYSPRGQGVYIQPSLG